MRNWIIIFCIFLSGCSFKEQQHFDIKLCDLWITWDDWQGSYWIDSLAFRADSISFSKGFSVDFFLEEEYLSADIDTIKFDNSNSKLIITYTRSPNFRNSNFAINNPIFKSEAGIGLQEKKDFVYKNVTYSVQMGKNKIVNKAVSKETNIDIETRLRYIFID